MSEPISFDLHLPAPPAPGGNRQTQGKLRRIWKSECDMHALAQLAGVTRIDGPYELSIVLKQSGNSAQLQSAVNELVAYLKQIELIHSAGPAHLKRLVLSWGSADEAPEGVRLQVQQIAAA
jgi:hypothetical protein